MVDASGSLRSGESFEDSFGAHRSRFKEGN